MLEGGVITNRYKTFHPGQTTCTFILGTKKLYDFVNDNPNILALDVTMTNDPAQIRRNPRMCAINSALEIDLTGQICADSLGTMQYSGVGGQLDFMRGAGLSYHGKPIITIPSQTSKGVSRIVNTVSFNLMENKTSSFGIAKTRCCRNYNTCSCSLCGDGIWCSEFVWKKLSATSKSFD